MRKFLMDDRDKQRKTSENGKTDSEKLQEHRGRQEAKTQDPNKAPKEKKPNKLFPNSVLFKTWGENLSEDEQKEAEALFQKYGYNAFLSDRLPLDRPLPDTRDPRYIASSFTASNRSHDSCQHSNASFEYFPLIKMKGMFGDRSHFFPLLNRCLEKKYPKNLPSIGVVLIYLDEALSIIKRALHSIISRTPKHLLKEIIMVDDNSSNGFCLF